MSDNTAKEYRDELLDDIRRNLDLFADSCQAAIDHADARRVAAEDAQAEAEERYAQLVEVTSRRTAQAVSLREIQ